MFEPGCNSLRTGQRFVEYHSSEWAMLVESGWTTWTVDTINGVQIATMKRFW